MKNQSINKPHVIAIVSSKGGVGKTTTTANLGGYLADQGKNVLLIDADVQPALTNYFRVDDFSDEALTFLMTNTNVVPKDVVSKIYENLSIVISDDAQGELQKWVRDTPDGRVRLRHILKERFADYDYILIDTQGAIGPLQEAAIFAADIMLSPVIADKISASEFQFNTLRMISNLSDSAKWLNLQIGPLYAVFNEANNTALFHEYSAEIKDSDYPSLCKTAVHVLTTQIPETVAYKEAASEMTAIHRLEKTSKRKSDSGLDTMRKLAEELGLV